MFFVNLLMVIDWSKVNIKSPISIFSFAVTASSYLNLNLCKWGFTCLQSITNLRLPFLFLATVKGFTTVGFSLTRDTHPFSIKFLISPVTNSGSSLADLLLLIYLTGFVFNEILNPNFMKSNIVLPVPILFIVTWS